jgi:thioredoxin reductase (NADPH)
MSDYLVRQLGDTRNLDVRLSTRVVDGRGKGHLEALTLEDVRTGRQEEVLAAAVFVLIGAEPHTEWLRDVVELDERGFILTGRDIPQSAWPKSRSPLPFETSVPGMFAAGDVRYGSVKRVAGAVGKARSPWALSTATCSSDDRRHLSSSHSSDNPIVGEQRAVVGVQHMM